METIFIIIGLISLIVGIYLTFVSDDESKTGYGIPLSATSVLWLMAASIISVDNIKQPTALDVYRGRTTLEITYKDSVAIDSVVVFKKN